MLFINPIEILELQETDIADINDNLIKKVKKKVIVDIDLSDDGQLNYKGLKITKSDCEKAIDELSNKDKKEYYYQLATTNQQLNNFLITGDESIFNSLKQESIYKLSDFIDFINPSFAYNFDRSLLKAFKKNNSNLMVSILRTQSLINQSNINLSFKSISNEIQNRIRDVDQITKEIKSKERECTEETVMEIERIVKNKFPIDIINKLPSYFQSQINKIASSINFLDVAIDDQFGVSVSSMNLMEHILKLNVESIGKQTFEANYEITKTKYNNKIEQQRNAPVLKKWASILNDLKSICTKIDSNTLNTKEAYSSVSSLVNVSDLNNLGSFADDIRDTIAYAIRSISISSWNVQKNIDTALKFIELAMSINVEDDTYEKFKIDFSELAAIKERRELEGEPIGEVPSLHTINGCGTSIYDDTLYFVLIWIPVIPIARYNLKQVGKSYTFYGKYKLHKWQLYWQYAVAIGVPLLIVISVLANAH